MSKADAYPRKSKVDHVHVPIRLMDYNMKALLLVLLGLVASAHAATLALQSPRFVITSSKGEQIRSDPYVVDTTNQRTVTDTLIPEFRSLEHLRLCLWVPLTHCESLSKLSTRMKERASNRTRPSSASSTNSRAKKVSNLFALVQVVK